MLSANDQIEQPSIVSQSHRLVLMSNGPTTPSELDEREHRGRAHVEVRPLGLTRQRLHALEVAALGGDRGLRERRCDSPSALAGFPRERDRLLRRGYRKGFPRPVDRCPRLGYERLGQQAEAT